MYSGSFNHLRMKRALMVQLFLSMALGMSVTLKSSTMISVGSEPSEGVTSVTIVVVISISQAMVSFDCGEITSVIFSCALL